MSIPSLSSETLHASCVAVNGRAVLISGRSGTGKSDLALRLLDRGAQLVSDDYTIVKRVSGTLVACAPASIAGKMEVRGVGIVTFDHVTEVPVALFIDLDRSVERLPVEGEQIMIAGIEVPSIALDSLEGSAPIKVELALTRRSGPRS